MTAAEVRVGLLYPDSGALAGIFSVSRAGYDARFGLENAEGGVHGRHVTYEWRDDEGLTSKNLTASQELVERVGVFAVAEASTAASGGAQYLADNMIPVVGVATEEIWSHFRNMFAFHYLFTSGGSVDTFGQFAHDHGGTRAMVVGALGRGDGLADQFASSLRAGGVEVSGDVPVEYTSGSSSPDRLAQQMLDGGIDTLMTTGTNSDFAEVIAAARRAEVPLKVLLSPTAVDTALLEQHGSALAGLTFFEPYIPFEQESPALDTYRDAMARYAPQLTDTDQTLALAAYINADMVIRGLHEAGPCPTRQAFIDGLRGVRDYTAEGLVPSTDFDAEFGLLKECYAFVSVDAAGQGFNVVDPDYCGIRLPG